MYRIIFYVIVALAGTGLVVGGYHAWKTGIRKAAEAQLMLEQLERVVGDVKKANEELRAITEDANEIRIELRKNREMLLERDRDIEESIIDPAEDRESSQVLKDTIRRLR